MPSSLRLFHAAIIVAMAAGAATPGLAQGRAVEICSTVIAHPGGGFGYEPRPDLNVRASTARPGPFRLDRPENVIGITCVRETLIPQPLDIEVLQAGFTFNIGDIAHQAEVVIELKLRDGRVSWDVIAGTLDRRSRERIDAAVARMNASLQA